MNFVILSVLAAAVAAGPQDNTYLPPNNARSAGGNGYGLNASIRGGSSRQREGNSGRQSSAAYGAPNAGGNYESHSGSAGSNFKGQSRDAGAGIVRFDNENFGDGSYKFVFETENRISHQETGELRDTGGEQESTVVRGSYSYTGEDGNIITVNYIADENGFQPTGDHLPTPPPIPEAIQRALEMIAAQGGNGEYQDNQGYQSNQGGSSGNGAFNQQNGYQY